MAENKFHPTLTVTNVNDPSKPLTIVTIPNSITLTSTNYLSWKTQIEAILIGYDLYKHLDGTPPTTITITIANDTTAPKPNPAYQTWFRQDKLIFGALIGTLSSNLVPLVSQAKTTHEMWDFLAKTYAQPNLTQEYTHEIIDLTSPPSSPPPAPKQKRRRKNNAREGFRISDKGDRLSSLPNDILVHLLSLMDMKSAGKTSLLSTRWRYVWTHLVDLDFEDSEFYSQRKRSVDDSVVKRYCKWVNKVITANRASNLNTFRIHFPLNGIHAAHIDKWVKLALSKNVGNLEINLSTLYGNPKGYDIYPILRDFLLICPLYNNHLDFLKSLHLEAICIDGPVLENVLAYCLNLESLTVRTCRFYTAIVRPVKYSLPKQRLVVSSLKLKHFELYWCHEIESLEISAPKLTSFILFAGSKKVEVEYTSVPSLVNVTFGGNYCYHVFHDLHLILAFSHRLQKLSLSWNRESRAPAGLPELPRDSLLSLISFIVACPLLHTFKLELFPLTRQAAVMPAALKDVKINYAMRAHRQLKVLELIGFDGSASVAEFAFCLTQNAPMLKKIICDTRCPQLMGFIHKLYDKEYSGSIASARRQAKLLAKQIQGGIDVVIL